MLHKSDRPEFKHTKQLPEDYEIKHMHSFDFVCLGAGGGPSETDLSAYVDLGAPRHFGNS